MRGRAASDPSPGQEFFFGERLAERNDDRLAELTKQALEIGEIAEEIAFPSM
jgi:hypothetical protein